MQEATAATQQKTDSPAFKSAAALNMHTLAMLPLTLMGDTPAMRDAGELYLPKWVQETTSDHKERVKAAVLFNFFKRAVRGLMGRLFSREITLGDDVPAAFKGAKEGSGGWLDNVDLQGNNLTAFFYRAAEAAWVSGIYYVLTEMPPFPKDEKGQPSRPDAATERATRRPYLVGYRSDQMLGFRAELAPNGGMRLTQMRFLEEETLPAGEYGEEQATFVRVLTPGAWKRLKRVKKGDSTEWELAGEGQTSLDYIPVRFVYGEFDGYGLGRPPLLDLAHLNVTHYQSYSDQRSILHFARIPAWAISGIPADEVLNIADMGPGVVFRFISPETKLEVVEHTGAAIEAGWKDLAQLEMKMAAMGLEPLLPKSGELTATSHTIETMEAHSALQRFAVGLEDTIEACLQDMAKYAAIAEGGGSVTVNKDFGITAKEAANLKALVDLTIAGKFPIERLYEELRRYGVVGPDFIAKDVVKELEKAKATEEDEQRVLAQAAQLRPDPSTGILKTGVA